MVTVCKFLLRGIRSSGADHESTYYHLKLTSIERFGITLTIFQLLTRSQLEEGHLNVLDCLLRAFSILLVGKV